MNSEQLLKHFDRISEAPDAIPRLRGFILDLAVRGKLVEQDPKDESASELYGRILAEKATFKKTRELRRDKSISGINSDEVPFPAPTAWKWVRIREVTSDRGQKIPDRDFTYIDVTAIDKEVGCVSGAKVVSCSNAPSRARKVVATGDVLYSCVRPYLLNIAIIERDISPAPIASTAFAVLNGFGLVLSKYLWITLRSPYMVACVESKMRGQAYPAINDSDFGCLPIPLPPLNEQHRIVITVDELMALCDRLEAVQQKREKQRNTLVAASLHCLNNGTDLDEFRNGARFYLNHISNLTKGMEHIRSLRKTVLSLAVRGRIVPQYASDEPANELLERIQTLKARLTDEGTLRKEKPLPAIAQDRLPFHVPASWTWARIGSCSLLTEYGTSVKSESSDDGVPVVKMGDIQDGEVLLGKKKTVPRKIDDLPQLFLKRFDILYNRTNSSDLVGKTGIYRGDDDAYTFASYLIRIRFPDDLIDPLYANLAMNAPYFRETQIIPQLQQQCGQANVNGSKLRNMIIPVPPLAEQHRIVAKVEALMAICSKLEAQEDTVRSESRRLLEAVLRQTIAV